MDEFYEYTTCIYQQKRIYYFTNKNHSSGVFIINCHQSSTCKREASVYSYIYEI